MKKFLFIFGGCIFLIGIFMAFDYYRDMQTAKKVMAEFKPNLMPIKDLSSLSKEENEAYAACLEQKIAASINTKDEHAFCRCFGTGMVQFVTGLVPAKDMQMVNRFTTLMKNAGEMGAKGAVIMKVCAENTSN